MSVGRADVSHSIHRHWRDILHTLHSRQSIDERRAHRRSMAAHSQGSGRGIGSLIVRALFCRTKDGRVYGSFYIWVFILFRTIVLSLCDIYTSTSYMIVSESGKALSAVRHLRISSLASPFELPLNFPAPNCTNLCYKVSAERTQRPACTLTSHALNEQHRSVECVAVSASSMADYSGLALTSACDANSAYKTDECKIYQYTEWLCTFFINVRRS